MLNDGIETNIKLWNPLTDPGDALRLAVALEMRLEISAAMTAAFASNTDVVLEHSDGNPLATTMRAITRAAAEIGRAKT